MAARRPTGGIIDLIRPLLDTDGTQFFVRDSEGNRRGSTLLKACGGVGRVEWSLFPRGMTRCTRERVGLATMTDIYVSGGGRKRDHGFLRGKELGLACCLVLQPTVWDVS